MYEKLKNITICILKKISSLKRTLKDKYNNMKKPKFIEDVINLLLNKLKKINIKMIIKDKKNLPYLIMAGVGIIFSMYFAVFLDGLLRNNLPKSILLHSVLFRLITNHKAFSFFIIGVIIVGLCIMVLILTDAKDYQSKQIIVTDCISTPVASGQGQHGTAEWLDKEQFEIVFGSVVIDSKNELLINLTKNNDLDIKDEFKRIVQIETNMKEIEERLLDDNLDNDLKQTYKSSLNELEDELTNPLKIIRANDKDINITYLSKYIDYIDNRGGIVLGKKDISEYKELIYFIVNDVHTLIIGATRVGKGRTVVTQTICNLGLAGESIVIADPKGESFAYCSYFLKLLGYNIVTIDFKNPKKSTRFNFLQPIINCVDNGDIPGAIDATWDITSQLVGESKGEKIWTDGESSMIAASIMAVVYDNRSKENHKYRNMTNVYYFISQMCTPVQVGKESVIPLTKYVQDLPFNHPSKGLLAVGDIAAPRTRSSFYTSALMTLKLFTNPLIADMTSTSEYDVLKVGKEKTAVFIILPDDKTTYYSLGSLYFSQFYQMQGKVADSRGGRLERRINFVWDEFGNFVKVPLITNMLTVGGGKGMRFNIFVQAKSQITDIYEEESAKTIMSQCENWIYLQTDDQDTLKIMSDKLGKYTISTYSLSANHQKFSNPSSSHNVSLTGRELLTPDEVGKIKRPYTLVTSRNNPAIFNAPDLGMWNFNKVLGLGSEEHNRRVKLARENSRKERKVPNDLVLWGIWDDYIRAIKQEQKMKEDKMLQQMIAKMQEQSNQFYNE